MRREQIKMKYYVIAPDSSGGKGDEAMMRGVLNVLSGADITVLTTPSTCYTWKTELLDRCAEFDEKNVPFDCISEGITGIGTLIVVGADVLDGTCGITPAVSRLCAMNKMKRMGGRVYAMCSFRSDVPKEIIDKIKEIGTSVKWFFREETSADNFLKLTGMEGKFFPDFAFYCERKQTLYTEHVAEVIEEKREQGYDIIGLNFSQQSCNSFFDARSDENRKKYVSGVLECLNRSMKNPFYVLISHDKRNYENHWSDTKFQELAEPMIDENRVLVLSDDVSYPELLVLLSKLDYIISGRMHLAVAGLRSGVVPVIFTGAGTDGKFSMAEKCKGMLENRLHMPELVATDYTQLQSAIIAVKRNYKKLQSMLQLQNERNINIERDAKKGLCKELGFVEKIQKHSVIVDDEIKALRDMVRNALELQQLNSQDLQKQLNDKQNLLDDKQKQLDDKQKQLDDKQKQLDDKQEQCDALYREIEKEKELVREIIQENIYKDQKLRDLQRQLDVLGEWIACYETTFSRMNSNIRELELKYQDMLIQNQRLKNDMHIQRQAIDKIKGLFGIRVFQKLSNIMHYKGNR